ncbi:MAG TPA: hypothetical protein VMQ56_02455 [Terracidiphilus sp.]|jgi:hypothetical protein|nr:hypothetical protein [Terracidiphilus sp.]
MATETATGKPAKSITETQSTVHAKRIFSPEYLAEQEELEKRLLEEGAKRIRRSCERAEALGIIDKEGNLLKKELPADMLPGADRDFGG